MKIIPHYRKNKRPTFRTADGRRYIPKAQMVAKQIARTIDDLMQARGR